MPPILPPDSVNGFLAANMSISLETSCEVGHDQRPTVQSIITRQTLAYKQEIIRQQPPRNGLSSNSSLFLDLRKGLREKQLAISSPFRSLLSEPDGYELSVVG